MEVEEVLQAMLESPMQCSDLHWPIFECIHNLDGIFTVRGHAKCEK